MKTGLKYRRLRGMITAMVLAMGAPAWSSSAARAPLPDGEPELVRFQQDAQSITIEFDEVPGPVRYLRLPRVPENLDVDALRRQGRPPEPDNNANPNDFTIPLRGEPDQGEYSVVVFIDDDYVEFVRQSNAWLQRTFAFARTGGYTILGRRSLRVANGSKSELGPLHLRGRPVGVPVQPTHVSPYPEINAAAGLFRTLVAQPYRQGPTPKSYLEFLGNTFEQKMEMVRKGDFAIQCTGFRDLFAHAASSIPGLKVRLVEAYNYGPQLPDLIPYAHSSAELWVQKLGRWVLFDPWMGVIVTRNGVPVGARELHDAPATRRFTVVPVVDHVPRMVQGEGDKLRVEPFSPAKLQLRRFSCTPLGCMPGYAEYFHDYYVRPVAID